MTSRITVARGEAECMAFRQIQVHGNHNNGDVFEQIVRGACEELNRQYGETQAALLGITTELHR